MGVGIVVTAAGGKKEKGGKQEEHTKAVKHTRVFKNNDPTPQAGMGSLRYWFLWIRIPPERRQFVVHLGAEELDGCRNGCLVGLLLAQQEGYPSQILRRGVSNERVIRVDDRVQRQHMAAAVIRPGFHTVREQTEPFLGHDLFELHGRVGTPGD